MSGLSAAASVNLCEPVWPSGKAGKQTDLGSNLLWLSFIFKRFDQSNSHAILGNLPGGSVAPVFSVRRCASLSYAAPNFLLKLFVI